MKSLAQLIAILLGILGLSGKASAKKKAAAKKKRLEEKHKRRKRIIKKYGERMQQKYAVGTNAIEPAYCGD